MNREQMRAIGKSIVFEGLEWATGNNEQALGRMHRKPKEGRIERWLRDLNWWAFIGCLVWPNGMSWRARHRVTNFMCLMLFRHVTTTAYYWYAQRLGTLRRPGKIIVFDADDGPRERLQ